ncbi:glycoside hydrolase domain-containing protein [Haliangium sp.]|uniref:glycoside hydrolase domain-containing protein n=1 Tax=Haliangium sp. TaxID=2663208 RepID=UPI003D0E32B8
MAPTGTKPGPGAGLTAAVAVALGLLWASPATAELASVWAVDDGTKIPATPAGHPLAAGNAVFSPDPPAIRLFGLRNETVAVQVILTGGAEATTGVTVTLDAVGPISNAGAVTDPRRDPDRWYVDRHIEIFTQRYVDIERRSHELAWLPDSDAEPAVPVGPMPDALVPHHAPLTVPAGANQGLWIDLYIPRDAPAGVHRGTIAVRVDGQVCELPGCRLPIELEVLAVALPDRPPVKTMLWASVVDLHGPHPGLVRYQAWPSPRAQDQAQAEAIARRHFQLARRYRVTLLSGTAPTPGEDLRQRLSGETFTRAAGYTGPGEGVGQDACGIHFYGGRLSPDQARRWADWLDEHGPGIDRFLYVVDEPSDPGRISHYNQIARDAEPIDAFVTAPYDPRYAEFDIFAAMPEDFDRVAEARAAGVPQWIYNGVRPYSGSFVIDDVAVATRVNPWIQYKHDIPRWFYWEATYYQDFQGGRGHIDVWNQAQNFSNRHGDEMNGDGLLMYPGRDLFYPDSDLGIDRPLPSIRLANWRRGIEDVGYLQLVRAAGHDALVQRLLATLLPRTLDQGLRWDDPVTWPEDGAHWLRARRILFDTLARGQPPTDIDWAALARPPEPWTQGTRRWLQRRLRPFVSSPARLLTSVVAGVLILIIVMAVIRRRRQAGDD